MIGKVVHVREFMMRLARRIAGESACRLACDSRACEQYAPIGRIGEQTRGSALEAYAFGEVDMFEVACEVRV